MGWQSDRQQQGKSFDNLRLKANEGQHRLIWLNQGQRVVRTTSTDVVERWNRVQERADTARTLDQLEPFDPDGVRRIRMHREIEKEVMGGDGRWR